IYSICRNLSFMPYKNRKSLSFDNENIRDLIFKGYIIPYLIDKSKNEIVILGIYKSNLWD
ncbi:type II toxin-antitoxin system RelE/ParE family toxin, partial [Campylobacter jejuni]|nr:type II toxin-antitoxin system RelE/ParE family toxin [Campylobacter jejuni]EAI9268819.1 type II toxin-antitoxin system RelE/ParE family toxin [Campylobacter jejuni]EDJ6220508.1 type II toxin-antitoxin system RelE/ParE family toxin [Campylobacter jejuni]EDP3113638.1 type II toxin-antitoxin system RelE/ParE family toxin [Campylobacter jejuni]EFO9444867.1 type II toxin-antitoxin system RelE/ParE family toxin [Campylobacter jejuni]